VSATRETPRSFESLAELAQTLTASLDLSVVLEAVTRAATTIVPGSPSRIWSLEGDRLVCRAQANMEHATLARASQFKRGEGLVGRVWDEGRVLICDDVRVDPRFANSDTARAEHLVSFVGVPLVAHGGVQGVLSLFTRHRHRFSPDELAALESFGTQAAIAIENARLFAREQDARAIAEASERRWLDLVNSLAAIVAEADATTWRFTFVSRPAEAILGYPTAAWLSDGFWVNHLHPDDRDRVVGFCLAETAAGRMHTMEYRMMAADGRVVWLRDTVRVVAGATGRPAMLQCLLVDITERKRAEDLLAREKRVLELTAAGAPLNVVLTALCTALEELSDGMLCSVLTADPDGMRLRHAAAPSLPEGYVQAVDGVPIGPAAGSCGTASYYRRVVVVEDVETDPRWKDYREVAARHGLRACWSTPLLSGAGQVLGTLAFYYRSVRRPGEEELRLVERAGHLAALAIERHRAVEAIARSEEQRRTMLVNIPDVVWWIDRNDRVLFISPGIETLTGYTAAELTQAGRRAWLDLVHPDDLRRMTEGWTALFDDGTPYNVEYRLRRRDGRWIWLNTRAVIIRSEDGEPSAYGVISDVTERKHAADIRTRLLNQIMSAQEDERRRIARELHDETAQSLASLLVGLDVLAATRTRKAAQAQVQELHRVAARALGEVRLLARGLRPAVLDDLGLVAAVEWYAGEFQRSRGIAVYSRATGVTGRLPAPVETALYRIMQEALANVSRHAEARAASVVIERRPGSVTMAVSDDGRGFDVGKVLAASESAGQLGLHSMRERALLLDGTVEVSSVTGAGTRILVELPLPEEARPAERPAEEATR